MTLNSEGFDVRAFSKCLMHRSMDVFHLLEGRDQCGVAPIAGGGVQRRIMGKGCRPSRRCGITGRSRV